MKKYLPHIAIVMLLLVTVYQCEKHREYKQIADANSTALTDSIHYYKNKIGTQTAGIKTLQLDNKQLHQAILSKDIELKKLAGEFASVKSMVKHSSTITFDTISVRFEPVGSVAGDSLHSFERKGSLESKWYSLGYKVTNDSLVIAPFKTWTETTVITGYQRKWFLGSQTLVTDITNSNPHISVKQIKAVEVIIPQPWYRKWYVWLAAGMAGGLLAK